jgi:hypothetical protein
MTTREEFKVPETSYRRALKQKSRLFVISIQSLGVERRDV